MTRRIRRTAIAAALLAIPPPPPFRVHLVTSAYNPLKDNFSPASPAGTIAIFRRICGAGCRSAGDSFRLIIKPALVWSLWITAWNPRRMCLEINTRLYPAGDLRLARKKGRKITIGCPCGDPDDAPRLDCVHDWGDSNGMGARRRTRRSGGARRSPVRQEGRGHGGVRQLPLREPEGDVGQWSPVASVLIP
jgi:hypothetical protein